MQDCNDDDFSGWATLNTIFLLRTTDWNPEMLITSTIFAKISSVTFNLPTTNRPASASSSSPLTRSRHTLWSTSRSRTRSCSIRTHWFFRYRTRRTTAFFHIHRRHRNTSLFFGNIRRWRTTTRTRCRASASSS